MFKKTIAIAAMLTAFTALADPGVASNAAEVKAIAAEKCTSGCIIFSPADVAELQAQVNAFAQRAFVEGAKQGFVAGQKDCRKVGKDA